MVTRYYGRVRIDWTDDEWARLIEVKRNRPVRQPNDILKATERSLVSALRGRRLRELLAAQPQDPWGFDVSVYHSSHRRTLNEVRGGLKEVKWLL